MKATEHFKQVIKSYLWQRAGQDPLFAPNLAKSNKSIDECVTYILNQVKKSGCNGFADDEIYSMAVHYYDEDNIEVGEPINSKVIVNHHVELTEQEIEQARQDAIKRVQEEEYKKIRPQQQKATPKKTEIVPQASLFDF